MTSIYRQKQENTTGASKNLQTTNTRSLTTTKKNQKKIIFKLLCKGITQTAKIALLTQHKCARKIKIFYNHNIYYAKENVDCNN